MRWSDYTEDLQAATTALRPGWCVFAHSMGGLVALDAVRAGLAPRRLAVSNPLVGVRVKAPRIKIAAAGVLSKLWPSLSLANEIDASGLSRDPEVGKAYANDPEVYSTVTPRWYTEMMAAIERVKSMAAPKGPTGFFLSDADPIVDTALGGTLARGWGVPIRDYPGMRHELVNEIGKEAVIGDIATWLEG
jgi:alpha-beta hydrolase superfamily lysophospholipase